MNNNLLCHKINEDIKYEKSIILLSPNTINTIQNNFFRT